MNIFRFHILFTFIGGLFLCLMATAQDSDTLKVSPQDSIMKKHSPRKAAIMSAVIPGLGQVYNRKYWKVPVIYAGLGTAVYFVNLNRTNYLANKNAYLARLELEDGEEPTDEFSFKSDAQLIADTESYRKLMEVSIIATAAVYMLNVIDASVDAHLFYFDVSDDLSVDIQPIVQPAVYPNVTFVGAQLGIRF